MSVFMFLLTICS